MADSIMYVKTQNCVTVTDDKNKLIRTSGADIRDLDDCMVDDRMYIYSIGNTMDTEEYCNYYETFITKANKEVSVASAKGKFVTNLDLGYIPVYIPPTFFPLEATEEFIERLEEKKIAYKRMYPLRIRGDRAGSELTDVWCTRKEIARVLNTTIDNINVLEFLKVVME